MGKKEKVIIASIVVAFMALVLGVTYAWFNTSVTGSGTTMTVTTAELSIEYRDGNEIARSNWFPGDSITKIFEVENTGTDTVFYDINFVIDTNTFERGELVYTLTSPTGANIVETPVPTSTGLVINAIALPFNQTHTYELTITFKEMSINQNQNQRQNFTGTIEIEADYLYTAGGLSFEGQLTNALGEAEVNALMTLHSDPKQTRTDANGYYKFENVSPGGHTLTVQTEGGETKEMSIHILSGATNEVQENSLVIKDKTPVNIKIGETLELERPPHIRIVVNNGTSDRALLPYFGVITPIIITPLSGFTTAEPTITCTNATSYTMTANTFRILTAEEDSLCTITLSEERDVEVAMYLDGVKTDSLSEVTSGYALTSYSCTNGATISWDYPSKTLSIQQYNKTATKCTLYFSTRPLVAQFATQGQYIDYTGNNGCAGNACIGCNAAGSSAGTQCNTTGGYCYSSSYKYSAYGWRVAYIDRNSTPNNYSDDSVYITTGGSPECLVASNSNPSSGVTEFNTASLKYCNDNYVYGGVCNLNSAWNMNETDFQKILGSLSTLVQCYNTSSASCGLGNDIIDNAGYYGYGATSSSNCLYILDPRYNYIAQANGIKIGVRPVIRLASGITHDGTGNGMQATPYILNSVY